MLPTMPTAIAALHPDLARYDGEPVEHFVLDMFHIAADPADAMITAAEHSFSSDQGSRSARFTGNAPGCPVVHGEEERRYACRVPPVEMRG